MGYMTPWECVHGEPAALGTPQDLGCKAYFKMPKYAQKEWRDKVFSGYFIGYAKEGVVGYRLYIFLTLSRVLVGVNVTLNEVVPSYSEEYFNELKKLSFEKYCRRLQASSGSKVL
jgi:hypothetical protein